MGKVLDFMFPRERIFYKMLNDAAGNVNQGVAIFYEFISKFPKLNAKQKIEYLKKIENIEDRGDRIIHTINERLNNVFITPIDKEDIHKLSGILDDIIDLVYGSTKQIVLYDLKRVDKCILELTKIINEGVKEVVVLVMNMKQGMFSKKNSVRIHQLEN